jgi:hypothetical protein
MKLKIYFILSWLLLIGCSGATGNVTSTNPIERGLSYIAAAIVTHGVLQIFFRK